MSEEFKNITERHTDRVTYWASVWAKKRNTFNIWGIQCLNFQRKAIQNTSFMCATPLRTILWCLMVMTFSSPCFGLVCLDGGEHESASDTELRKIQHVMMEASWKKKMYSQYNCFIPFKLRSNPSHLSQWLCCNILIFSSGSIWINVSKYKYQTRRV